MFDQVSRTKRIAGMFLVVLQVLLTSTMVGCSKQPQKTVKIGAIYPFTGTLAATGTDIRNSILLAIDIINNKHNLDLPLAKSNGLESLDGAKVDIVFADSQGSPAIAEAEAARLIDKEKVVALIGCYQSAVTEKASQVAETKRTPFLTATSTAPSLTKRGFNWFFRTTPNENTFVQNFYEFLKFVQTSKGVEVKTLALVYENSIWGSEVGSLEKQLAEKQGYKVVKNIPYPADIKDVSGEVQKLIRANPDVVLQSSYSNDAILYTKAYNKAKFSPDAVLANDAGYIEPIFIETVGAAGNYILTRETWSKDLSKAKPLIGTINQMFKKRYGTDMNGNSARAFTGMLVLADAINRAGSTKPEAIRDALLKTSTAGDQTIMPWDGVKFNQTTHQNILGKGIIVQIINKKYYTVWPQNLASRELIWPMQK